MSCTTAAGLVVAMTKPANPASPQKSRTLKLSGPRAAGPSKTMAFQGSLILNYRCGEARRAGERPSDGT